MRLTYWLFLFVASCTSNKSASSKDRYEVMNDLWQNKANKLELISALGTDYHVVPSGITYSFKSFKYPKSGHFFNQANQLTVQFIFLEKSEFETFNDKIKCPWNVEKRMVSSGHTVKTIEYGECKSLSIKYTYPSNLNTYEIRWEK